MANPHTSTGNPFDTAIYVRVKRHDQTFFVLCDEYEEVGAFKARVLDVFQQTGAVKMHEEFSIDDIRLCSRNRVSNKHQSFLLEDESLQFGVRLIIDLKNAKENHSNFYILSLCFEQRSEFESICDSFEFGMSFEN
jgi:hypothetical protein